MICDFCLRDGASVVLDVGASVGILVPGKAALVLGRFWAACEVCQELFNDRRWDDLAARMRDAMLSVGVVSREGADQAATSIVEVMRAAQVRSN